MVQRPLVRPVVDRLLDQWAATFGEVVSGIEVAPDGSGFRMKARFAKFTNVPELLRAFHVFGDVKTAEDLKLPAPALAPRPGDGQRTAETVVVAPSSAPSWTSSPSARTWSAAAWPGGAMTTC